jgi:hypothetical protein
MRRSISWVLLVAGLGAGLRLENVGRLDDPDIREASGIVRSRRHPGIFWVHNDSGNPPVLFAVNRDGKLVRSFRVEAPNVDWEDIAADEDGHLFFGDIGNNGLRLPIRTIYRIDEPDPSRPADLPLKPSLITNYRFPPEGRFDAEGLFLSGGRAMVVSKRFDGKEAEVFAIPLDPPAPLLRPALPERMARLPGCVEPATGADLSADGRRLAVSTTSAARVYVPDGRGGWALESTVRYEEPHVEAICWDGDDLILASEDRSIYRISAARWKASRGDGR